MPGLPAYRELLDSGTDAGLTPHDAELLQLVVQQPAGELLEVGMANGVSSLVILEHLPAGGRLTSIDPNSRLGRSRATEHRRRSLRRPAPPNRP